MFRSLVALLSLLALAAPLIAKNLDGRFDASPHREWFESLGTPEIYSCCGVADAYFTDEWYIKKDGSAHVEVQIAGAKYTFEVPAKKVLMNKAGSNPVGRGVVFVAEDRQTVYCFVPAPQA
jgi:hypothetical protein